MSAAAILPPLAWRLALSLPPGIYSQPLRLQRQLCVLGIYLLSKSDDLLGRPCLLLSCPATVLCVYYPGPEAVSEEGAPFTASHCP